MKKLIILFVIFTIAVYSCPAVQASAFNDVPADYYCYGEITEVKRLNIISGYPDGSFRPEKAVTRAEMASLLCRMLKEPPTHTAGDIFTDVDASHWASGYIAIAHNKKIIGGNPDGSFRPEDSISYEEAVKMAVMATEMSDGVKPYPGIWWKAYDEIAKKIGITGNIRAIPGDVITRADAAVLIYNTLKAKEKNYILFANHIYNNGQNIPTNASFALDSHTFLGSNTVYNPEIAKASVILAMTSYTDTTLDATPGKNTPRILKSLKFENLETVDLAKTFGDNHITKLHLGKKALDETHDLVSVTLCGTRNGITEWSSNFDIGDGLENNEYRKENHRGFDITATRAMAVIEEYISTKLAEGKKPIVWISGHSRGGSVANICAAYLADKGIKTFAYTFGSSQTTVSANKDDYGFIFNIINNDDIITRLPVKQWGFDVYGKVARISVGEELYHKWSEATGLKKYNYSKRIADAENAISSAIPDRKSCYSYRDDYCFAVGFATADEREKGIAYLKSSFLSTAEEYCKFELWEDPAPGYGSYAVTVYMQPAFLMHNVAAVIAGKINALKFMEMPLPMAFNSIRAAVGTVYTAGMVHPHTPETYLVITGNITEDNFK